MPPVLVAHCRDHPGNRRGRPKLVSANGIEHWTRRAVPLGLLVPPDRAGTDGTKSAGVAERSRRRAALVDPVFGVDAPTFGTGSHGWSGAWPFDAPAQPYPTWQLQGKDIVVPGQGRVTNTVPVAQPNSVIMQPTTLCNLDCRYCYLPHRKQNRQMTPAVARAVAKSVRPWTKDRAVDIVWHGGEPLAAGRERFAALLGQFEEVEVFHSVQTNAVLIDAAWSAFFAERRVRVGVSVDGAEHDNTGRVDLARRPAFPRIERGIRRLVADGHSVSVIAVVSDPTPERARRLYSTVADLGARWLGVNIEECEGVNKRSNAHHLPHVRAFWSALLEAWSQDGRVGLRDVDRVLGYAVSVLDAPTVDSRSPLIDPLPTVAWNGAVTLISPELAGFHSERLGAFECGNVLAHDLDSLIERGLNSAWVTEYRRGLNRCRAICRYFEFCGGGHPANKYFEHGRLDGAETNYCRNGKIALVEGVLDVAGRNGRTR